jgi:hypothetical protein
VALNIARFLSSNSGFSEWVANVSHLDIITCSSELVPTRHQGRHPRYSTEYWDLESVSAA